MVEAQAIIGNTRVNSEEAPRAVLATRADKQHSSRLFQQHLSVENLNLLTLEKFLFPLVLKSFLNGGVKEWSVLLLAQDFTVLPSQSFSS